MTTAREKMGARRGVAPSAGVVVGDLEWMSRNLGLVLTAYAATIEIAHGAPGPEMAGKTTGSRGEPATEAVLHDPRRRRASDALIMASSSIRAAQKSLAAALDALEGASGGRVKTYEIAEARAARTKAERGRRGKR